MYTVKVYKDDIIIDSRIFYTLRDAFNYAEKYCVEYYIEINNVPYYLEA